MKWVHQFLTSCLPRRYWRDPTLLIISGGTSASTLRIFELSEFSKEECLEWNDIGICRGQTGRKKLQTKNVTGKPLLQIPIRIRMFWASRIRIYWYKIRIRILLSSSKNSKKNLDSYCFFVTSLWLFILEKWFKCSFKKYKLKDLQIFIFFIF